VSDDDLDLPAVTDQVALRALAERYAAGVDRRDRALFLSAFHADGVLVLLDRADPTQVAATRRGHAELGDVTELIARYDKTFHFIGNSRYEVDGDRATGEVYCVAHHLDTARHGGTDYVMMIRYLDTYTRRDGRWGIDERRLVTDWTELRTANRL
jgi:hypothetical protein